MKRFKAAASLLVMLAAVHAADAGAQERRTRERSSALSTGPAAPAPVPSAVAVDGRAEARLIQIYRLIGDGRAREALVLAQALAQEHPNFQLAQLVLGDLLSAQARPLRSAGDIPEGLARQANGTLTELREEALQRLRALRERPPPGTVPAQFLRLSARNRHAIAVDASRSRLYLFENGPAGLRLIADYYVSVGRAGIDKVAEGDLRTPLGVYFITSQLDPKTLRDFYGSGALPINYPNAWDQRRGRTGSGIWLHGTPPSQFSRAPRATDGCIVLANPDLERLLRTVQPRTTPVVIAGSLHWVPPQSQSAEIASFERVLDGWRAARQSGDIERVLSFYTPEFPPANSRGRDSWSDAMRQDLERLRGRPVEVKDLSLLRWSDGGDTMVVTFGEVVEGQRRGLVRRQYWLRQGGSWRIFHEGVIG